MKGILILSQIHSTTLKQYLYLSTSSLLGSNILLSTLFSNTFSLRSFLSVSDLVSHPYKTFYYYITIYYTTVV
jgi:hypothetical protein